MLRIVRDKAAWSVALVKDERKSLKTYNSRFTSTIWQIEYIMPNFF